MPRGDAALGTESDAGRPGRLLDLHQFGGGRLAPGFHCAEHQGSKHRIHTGGGFPESGGTRHVQPRKQPPGTTGDAEGGEERTDDRRPGSGQEQEALGRLARRLYNDGAGRQPGGQSFIVTANLL